MLRSIVSFREAEEPEGWEGQPALNVSRGLPLGPPGQAHSTHRTAPLWKRHDSQYLWSCLGSLESTCWDTDVLGSKASLVLLTAFFPPSAQRTSPVPAPPQPGNLGDQAAATVLPMVRPQVSLVLSDFPEFPSLWPRNSRAHLQGLGPP